MGTSIASRASQRAMSGIVRLFKPKVTSQGVIESYTLKDDGSIPNSRLPVLHYRGVLDLPAILPSVFVKRMLAKNGWTNAWTGGIYTFEHFHSNTHEVLAIINGSTKLRLGGKNGISITVRKGDVLILPAGTAHRNLQDENAVVCVGAYPLGKNFDVMRGNPEEWKTALENIKVAAFPSRDPVFGIKQGTGHFWSARRSVSQRTKAMPGGASVLRDHVRQKATGKILNTSHTGMLSRTNH